MESAEKHIRLARIKAAARAYALSGTIVKPVLTEEQKKEKVERRREQRRKSAAKCRKRQKQQKRKRELGRMRMRRYREKRRKSIDSIDISNKDTPIVSRNTNDSNTPHKRHMGQKGIPSGAYVSAGTNGNHNGIDGADAGNVDSNGNDIGSSIWL